MKKVLIVALFCLFASDAKAQMSMTPSYIEEMRALGTVSGNAMACGAPKYTTFEMLARAILVTKAISDKNQEEGMIAYNTAKADAFLSKQADGMYNCDEINELFTKQKIFKTTLYGDGTIKMYDGKVYRPRHPYDATMLKDDENNNRAEAVEIYEQAKQKRKGQKKSSIVEIKSVNGSQQPTVMHAQPKRIYNTAQPVASSAVRASQNRAFDNGGIRHISNKNR